MCILIQGILGLGILDTQLKIVWFPSVLCFVRSLWFTCPTWNMVIYNPKVYCILTLGDSKQRLFHWPIPMVFISLTISELISDDLMIIYALHGNTMMYQFCYSVYMMLHFSCFIHLTAANWGRVPIHSLCWMCNS